MQLVLVFRLFDLPKFKVTGRADGGIVGAQASGDARALRRPVDFVREAPGALSGVVGILAGRARRLRPRYARPLLGRPRCNSGER